MEVRAHRIHNYRFSTATALPNLIGSFRDAARGAEPSLAVGAAG